MATKKKVVSTPVASTEPKKTGAIKKTTADDSDVALFETAQTNPEIVRAAGIINGESAESIFTKIVAAAKALGK